jgi:hypothetical protein
MRGKVTDQDLTDYALNELPPDERLYVESMLAISEECRNDVYQMLEMSEMLKEGLEAEEIPDFILDEEQRSRVLSVPSWTLKGFFRKVAAIAILAAGTAYALSRPGVWQEGGTVDRLANASQAVQLLVGDLQTKDLPKTAEELIARIQAASPSADGGADFQLVSAPAAVCTPPVFVEMPAVADIVEM